MTPRFACLMMIAALALPLRPAGACTTFCFEDGGTLVFGRNYDWNIGDGLVIVNKSGVRKTAMVDVGAATWTSKYGSTTFNQYGREFPTGGMNERGLVVELMWLDVATYPGTDGRGVLPTLQWIQYQLDNAATVDDVIASDRSVRIATRAPAKIHFLVADADGHVAAVEFLMGTMVVHRGDHMPYPVLANDTYDASAEYAKKVGPRAGKAPVASLDRFARAASYRPNASTPDAAVKNAFALLDDVAQVDHTQWSIVYDVRARRIFFRTRTSTDVRWIDFSALSFACDTPVKMLDVNAPLSGDVGPKLVLYRVETNQRLVETAFTSTPFVSQTSADTRNQLSHYPESTTCAADRSRGSGK